MPMRIKYVPGHYRIRRGRIERVRPYYRTVRRC